MRILSAILHTSITPALLLHASPIVGADVEATAAHAATEASNAPADSGDEQGRASATNEPGDAKLVSGVEASTAAAAAVGAVAGGSEGGAESQPSAAERIARLETSLETDEERLQELHARLEMPESEYAKAEAGFRDLDERRTATQQKLQDLEKAGKQDELAQLQIEAAALEKKWTLAKERFDLAIGERKAMQESVVTLERKLESDHASLVKLKDAGQPQPLVSPPAGQPQPAQPLPPAAGAAAASPQTPPQEAPQNSPPAPAPAPAASGPSGPPIGPQQPTAPPGPTKVETAPILTEKIAKELAVASKAAQKSQAAAKAAEDEARTITDRIDILAKDIGLQRKLRDSARKTVDNSEKMLHSLNEDLLRKLMAGESIDDVRRQIAEASARLHENRIKSQEISTRLDELQSRLAHLQSEKLTAANDLARKQAAAEHDQAVVEKLQNPFTLRNLLQWLIDHGPRIMTILGALALFMWLSRICEARLVELTAKRGRRGSREERENRARTLLGVFRSVANILLIAGGGMMILDEVGVPVAPIIGGAAVFGLAVAFGAQSLIKDYFVGFMVLLEQQYLVNDVIEIGPVKGQVERVSLRITVLRDLEGRVHFVPHSQINTVTNLTHGWSRAVFEIGVAYRESVDHVIAVLTALAEKLRRDEAYKLLILSDPVMLGVDSFGDSAVVIKFYIQTRPLQQWTVKREMLRRIKNEFDRLGIEIPFPHMTIYRGIPRVEEPVKHERSDDWPDRNVA
jgi:moderate conductance mechanosensitive channel